MPTSGSYLWSPELADCVDDAFERAKVDPRSLDVQHIISARRSIDFMLVEWAADDFHTHRVERITDFPLVQGTEEYTLDPDADGRIIDVIQVAIRRNGNDTQLYPMSRQELLDIPSKTTQGFPNRYFADKQRDNIVVTLWPVPENSTDTLQMNVVRKFQDGGGAANEPDLPYYMREAFTAGLAYRLGHKYAPEQIIPRLGVEYDRQYKLAQGAQRNNNGDVAIVPMQGRRHGRGGRLR